MQVGIEIRSAGHRIDGPCFASFEVRVGKIVSEQIYFDRMLLSVQLELDLTATA